MNRLVVIAAAAAAFLFAAPAYANPNDGGPLPGCSPSSQTPQKCDDGGSSPSTSSVVATLVQGQLQGQTQDQTQDQTQTSVNVNRNANVNTNANANVNSNTNTSNSVSSSVATGGNATATGGSARSNSSAAGGNSSTNNSGNSNVTVEGDTYNMRRIPVSTAYAPALTSGIDTCSGSFSAGAQTGVFGISFGGTKHDETCQLIKLGREAAQMGMPDVQCQVLALDPRFNEALRRANRSCNLPVANR